MPTSRRLAGALVTGVLLIAGASSCSHSGPEAAIPRGEHACRAARRGARTIEPLTRQGSSVALVRSKSASGKRLVAFVANRAAKRVDEVDVETKARLAHYDLAGEPEQILAMADGRILVSLSDRSAIQVLAIDAPGEKAVDEGMCLIDVPSGPSGLAASDDASRVVVSSTSASSLTVLDAAKLEPERTLDVPRSPAGVLASGGRAFVTHLAGPNVSIVALDGTFPPYEVDLGLLPATSLAPASLLKRERTAAQAYSLVEYIPKSRPPRIIVPEVTVDPGDPESRAIYYGPPPTLGIAKETPVAVSLDRNSELPDLTHQVSVSEGGFRDECLLPRASAIRASTSRLYVACRGIDQIVELDADAADPMRSILRRFEAPKGATGIAIADEEGLAATYGEFDEKLSVVRLDTGAKADIDLSGGGPLLSLSYREGRELFYQSNDARIAFDGVACASCHPDGRDDGLTWATPEGRRQTPMLTGRVHGTEPYGWTRGKGNLPDYIADTIKRLGGTGLDHSSIVALASYVERMPAPATGSSDSARARHGAEVFVRAGCSGCHVDGGGTDHLGHSFTADVPTPYPSSVGDPEAFDTPSLRFVGLSAPYFHDGRYDSLEQLLGDPNSGMGLTAHLSTENQRDLAAYLRTL